MRFLVDECTGPAVAAWLQEQNLEVFSEKITPTVYWIHLL